VTTTTTLPRSISVAGQRVKVRTYDELRHATADGQSEALFGSFETGDMEISIVRGQSPERERLTLLHEATHFLWSIGRFDDCHDEEMFVARFTPLLLSFLRSNPNAVTYLQEVRS
jgi:hypothetical protein